MKRYINSFGIIVGVGAILMIVLLLDKSSYEDFVENPLDRQSKSTSGILIQYVLYYMDKYLTKCGIFAMFSGLSILGFYKGIKWNEIFKKG